MSSKGHFSMKTPKKCNDDVPPIFSKKSSDEDPPYKLYRRKDDDIFMFPEQRKRIHPAACPRKKYRLSPDGIYESPLDMVSVGFSSTLYEKLYPNFPISSSSSTTESPKPDLPDRRSWPKKPKLQEKHHIGFTNAIKPANNTNVASIRGNYEKLREYKKIYQGIPNVKTKNFSKYTEAAACMRYLKEIYKIIKGSDDPPINHDKVQIVRSTLTESEIIQRRIRIDTEKEKQRLANLAYMRSRGFDVSALLNADADDVRSAMCWHAEVNPDPKWFSKMY